MIRNILNWLHTAKPQWKKNTIKDLTDDEKMLLVDIIQEEVDELESALQADDRAEVLDAVGDIYWTSTNSLAACGFTKEEIDDHMERISRSNWSKFCGTELCAKNTVKAYEDGTHPSKPGKKINTYYERIGDVFVIFREDGKIMKSIHFNEPNQ